MHTNLFISEMISTEVKPNAHPWQPLVRNVSVHRACGFWILRASTVSNLTTRCFHAVSNFKDLSSFFHQSTGCSHTIKVHNVPLCCAGDDHGQLFHYMFAILSLSETESKWGGRTELRGGWGWGGELWSDLTLWSELEQEWKLWATDVMED